MTSDTYTAVDRHRHKSNNDNNNNNGLVEGKHTDNIFSLVTCHVTCYHFVIILSRHVIFLWGAWY